MASLTQGMGRGGQSVGGREAHLPEPVICRWIFICKRHRKKIVKYHSICGRQNNTPPAKDIPVLGPGTCEYITFASMVVMGFAMERLSLILWMGPV